MPANLTNTNIKDTYPGVLHVDGALPAESIRQIYDGVGNASALQVGKSGQGAKVIGSLELQNGVLFCGGMSSTGTVNIIGTTNITGAVNVTGTITATSYNSSSSKRYKTNIIPLHDSLEIVSKLRGVRFQWRNSEKHDIGLIAEEVNEVVPEVVGKNEAGEVESIDYSKLVSVLINSVNTLSKRVEELEAKLK